MGVTVLSLLWLCVGVTVLVSYRHIVPLCCCHRCHGLVTILALRWCHCLGVIVPLCVTVLLSWVSLSWHHCVTVLLSLCRCNGTTVSLRCSYYRGVIGPPCVTVLLSQVSLSCYHGVGVTVLGTQRHFVSQCCCHRVTVLAPLCLCVGVAVFGVITPLFVTVLLSLCHCVAVTMLLSWHHCVSVLLSLCHCLAVTMLLSWHHCVSVSLSLCHCLGTTVSLCCCRCVWCHNATSLGYLTFHYFVCQLQLSSVNDSVC